MAINLLVQSDALVLMERLDTASVDMVYLDPIWPKDKMEEEEEAKYYDYIYKVIQQAHRLLKPTGNLVYFSDPSINIKFSPLIAKVFKPENHIMDFVFPRRAFLHQKFSQIHSTVIFYKKTDEHTFNNRIIRTKEEIEKLFPYHDEKGRYRTMPLLTNTVSLPTHNFIWQGIKLPENRRWRFSKKKLDELKEQGLVVFKKDIPQYKKYLEEGQDDFKNIPTIWDDINSLPKKISGFLWSQPEALLERIIKIGTNEGEIVLDPFCGSGTVPAVASQSNRRWIAGDHEKTAIEVCKTRISGSFSFKLESAIKKLPIKWNAYASLFESEDDLIWAMIQDGESSNVEFKMSAVYNYETNKEDKKGLMDNVLSTIASFLNSDNGGTLLIGVKNNKGLIDLSVKDYETANPQKKDQDGYELYLSDKIKHSLGAHSLNRCKIAFHIFNEVEICSIKIKPSKTLIFYQENFIVRLGNGKKTLSNLDFYHYIQGK